jgi:hypothetical protein
MFGTTAWPISMARRQVVESANSALKGAFADLSRGFFGVLGLIKTTVLLGFTPAVYNLDRIRSFKAKHGLNDARSSRGPSSAGPADAPGRGPRSPRPALLPADVKVAGPSSRHHPTAPAVGFSAFWIDEGADREAREVLSGAVERPLQPWRCPSELPPGNFH